MYTEDHNEAVFVLIDETFHDTGDIIYRGESLDEAMAWTAIWENGLGLKTFLSIDITQRNEF